MTCTAESCGHCGRCTEAWQDDASEDEPTEPEPCWACNGTGLEPDHFGYQRCIICAMSQGT